MEKISGLWHFSNLYTFSGLKGLKEFFLADIKFSGHKH